MITDDVIFSHFDEIVEELHIFGKVIVNFLQISDIINRVFLLGNVPNSQEIMPVTARQIKNGNKTKIIPLVI